MKICSLNTLKPISSSDSRIFNSVSSHWIDMQREIWRCLLLRCWFLFSFFWLPSLWVSSFSRWPTWIWKIWVLAIIMPSWKIVFALSLCLLFLGQYQYKSRMYYSTDTSKYSFAEDLDTVFDSISLLFLGELGAYSSESHWESQSGCLCFSGELLVVQWSRIRLFLACHGLVQSSQYIEDEYHLHVSYIAG